MTGDVMVRVCVSAEAEAYPVVSAYRSEQGQYDVPEELIAAHDQAWDAYVAAGEALLRAVGIDPDAA